MPDLDLPSLPSLAARMRAAADTLEAANTHTGNGSRCSWSADELRAEADHVEAEDKAAAEREAIADELARDLYKTAGWSGWNPSGNQPRDEMATGYMNRARKLVEKGWRKGEPDA